jgi:hypothetical protein
VVVVVVPQVEVEVVHPKEEAVNVPDMTSAYKRNKVELEQHTAIALYAAY